LGGFKNLAKRLAPGGKNVGKIKRKRGNGGKRITSAFALGTSLVKGKRTDRRIQRQKTVRSRTTRNTGPKISLGEKKRTNVQRTLNPRKGSGGHTHSSGKKPKKQLKRREQRGSQQKRANKIPKTPIEKNQQKMDYLWGKERNAMEKKFRTSWGISRFRPLRMTFRGGG